MELPLPLPSVEGGCHCCPAPFVEGGCHCCPTPFVEGLSPLFCVVCGEGCCRCSALFPTSNFRKIWANHNREGNSLAASGAALSPSKTDPTSYEGIPLEDYFSLVKIYLDKSLNLLPSPRDGTSISNAGVEKESF